MDDRCIFFLFLHFFVWIITYFLFQLFVNVRGSGCLGYIVGFVGCMLVKFQDSCNRTMVIPSFLDNVS